MTDRYATPGVYIEEVTGPGVIAGVGTSTAAFIGPALRGPLNAARRVTTFDEFIRLYGGARNGRPWPYLFVQGRPYYLAFGVEGFFTNGGQQAYVVRVGTAAQASLPVQNQAGDDAFVVRANEDGVASNAITVETQLAAAQAAATGSAQVTNVVGATVTVDGPAQFRAGDFVTTDGANRAQINQILGNDLVLNAPLAGAANGDTLRIDDIEPGQMTIRLAGTAGLAGSSPALISGDDAGAPGTTVTERVLIQSLNTATNVVMLAAAPARTSTYNMAAATPPALTAIRVVATGQATINAVNGATLTVAAPGQLRPGDIVTVNGADRALISRIQGNDVILDQVLPGAANGATLRIANITPAQMTFRVADIAGLAPGTVAILQGDDAANPGNTVAEYVVIQAVNGAGFVTLEPLPARASAYNLNVAAGDEPILIPQEFRLIVNPPPPASGAATPQRFENLSLNPFHPRYIFNTGVITSDLVSIEAPATPPTTNVYPDRLVAISGATSLAGGGDDQPSALTAAEYQDGLNVLRDVDDVNMVCIPDAASHADRQTIQNAMIIHCLDLWDRVAILDSAPGAPPSGPDSVETQRQQVESQNGFAALYYPWLLVRDPNSSGPQPRTMFIPPSGHIAGVFARTDVERGVHKAPANTDVRGVLGLEQRLSDRQQAPLNLAGVNVLRIFPGTAQVVVWGARTTVRTDVTDWKYVNVRRLMLYIEESIEEGIRWAVFEPNNLSLWQKLKLTIGEFLARVWRDGALFGETADKAFYVRIDEGLNPPATQALGRLYIEIGVRPSYPAEFIIVRIGLWSGGAEVSE